MSDDDLSSELLDSLLSETMSIDLKAKLPKNIQELIDQGKLIGKGTSLYTENGAKLFDAVTYQPDNPLLKPEVRLYLAGSNPPIPYLPTEKRNQAYYDSLHGGERGTLYVANDGWAGKSWMILCEPPAAEVIPPVTDVHYNLPKTPANTLYAGRRAAASAAGIAAVFTGIPLLPTATFLADVVVSKLLPAQAEIGMDNFPRNVTTAMGIDVSQTQLAVMKADILLDSLSRDKAYDPIAIGGHNELSYVKAKLDNIGIDATEFLDDGLYLIPRAEAISKTTRKYTKGLEPLVSITMEGMDKPIQIYQTGGKARSTVYITCDEKLSAKGEPKPAFDMNTILTILKQNDISIRGSAVYQGNAINMRMHGDDPTIEIKVTQQNLQEWGLTTQPTKGQSR